MRRWRGLCMFVLALVIGGWVAILPNRPSSWLALAAVAAAVAFGWLYCRAWYDDGEK